MGMTVEEKQTSSANTVEASALDKEAAAFLEDDLLRERANEAFSPHVSMSVKIGSAVALVAAVLISFAIGPMNIMPDELVQTIWAHITGTVPPNAAANTVLFNIRLPRVLCVVLVGAALSTAGAAYQGMFKNPLVSPDLLGANAGASFAACLALLCNQTAFMVTVWAFAGGLVAVVFAVWLHKIVRYDETLSLVLAGIMVSTLFESGVTLVKCMADAYDKLPSITYWLMGSFSSANMSDFKLCLIPIIVGIVMLVALSNELNAMSMGEDEAHALGVNTKRSRMLVIFASTLVTSASVAIAGVVGWIGLVVPHMARAIVGSNYKALLPASIVIGSTFLIVIDTLARSIATVEVPIGVLTAIIGVPMFLVVFRRNVDR